MEKLEYQEKDGKVFCPLANKWLVAKPEEKVRQKYICILVNDYGYSLDQMAQEQKVNNSQRGQGKARADIVIWKSKKDKDDRKAAFIVVECKAENVKIRVEDYYQGFNYAAWAHADFFVTTNEKETKFFNVDPAFLPQKLEEVIAIPTAEDVDNAQKIEQIKNQTKTFTREEFTKTLQACHNISTLITPVKRRIKKADYDGILPVVSKIVFKSGEIIFRKENKTGMDLLYIKKGDLLVSSINFHQGAVAINNIGDFVCSTHYQSFSIDTTSVVPEYLITVLRSKSFINMVAGLKANGIKNESGYDFIGGFGIPVPSIPEQQEILKAYHTTLAEAGDNIAKGDSFSDGLLSDIQSKVSTLKKQEHRIETLEAIMQIIPFAATRRWEVGYILKEGRLEDIYGSFKYKSYSIHELQTESLFGLSVKASLEQKKEMIPVLRMSNVVNGEIDYSELKYLPLKCATTNKEPDKWLLRNGDFLITRTNGSKDLVGKAAVFHGKDVYTYASYLIRYRFDISIVLPEYVNILFMTQLVREQIAVMRRQGGGQYNLNSDEIGAIRIPVPSIPEQQAIVAAYDSAKDGANIYYDKGQTLKEKAAADFEKCIFA